MIKTKLLKISAALAIALAAPFASATVLTFDDLTGQSVMVNGYGGFDWTGWSHYDWAQSPFNPSSGSTRLYNDNNNASISSASAFTLEGAYFSGQAAVSFNMYLGNSLVASSGWLTTTSTPTFLSSSYNGLIDKIVVNSNQPNFFTLDDLTVNSVSAVPEPETYAMLLAGLGVMGAVARRRKAKQA